MTCDPRDPLSLCAAKWAQPFQLYSREPWASEWDWQAAGPAAVLEDVAAARRALGEDVVILPTGTEP